MITSSDNLLFNSENQHYYQVSDTSHASWADAVAEANELGGYLVTIDNVTELNLLQQSVDSNSQFWIGGESNNVFAAATGNSYIASPTDNLALTGIIEFDSIDDYYDGLGYSSTPTTSEASVSDDSSLIDIDTISNLLPSTLSYLWDTVSIEETAENTVELSWQDEINLTDLFNVGGFLPNLAVDNPTFVITEDLSSTTYEFAGDITISSESFGLGASFTKQGTNQYDWDEFSISDFSVSSLASWVGSTIDEVDNVFGDSLPTIDVTVTEEQLDFSGTLDFANSTNEYLGWINDNLNLDTLDVGFSYNTSQEINLYAGISGEFNLIKTNDLDATLTNVALGFAVSGSGASLETAFSIEAEAKLDIHSDGTSLELTGGIEFAVGTGGFEAEGYFALDAGQGGWNNPFGLPDATIYSFGLGLGIGVAGVDSFGFYGDLQFGSYDFEAAFSVDLTNPNEFALAATLNQPISVLDLITGPAASYALGQAANNVSFIDDAKNIMDEVLDVDILSTDSDNDGELDPLIYIVPEATDIAGKTYEPGFSVNAAVSAWGQEASLYFNANADTGEISGGLEIERIEIGIEGIDDDILVIEGSDLNQDSSDANDATLVNATISDGTLNLDGSGDYAEVNNDSELNFGTNSFTVEAWVYDDPNSAVDFNNAVSKKIGGGTTSGWALRLNQYDQPQFFLADGTNRVDVNSSTAIAEGEWYHLAGVVDRNNNEARLYVNGVLVATQSITNLGSVNTEGEFRIGTWDTDSNQDYWHGQIDNVRVWNASRSDEEISTNYQETLKGTEESLVAYYEFDSSYVETTTEEETVTIVIPTFEIKNGFPVVVMEEQEITNTVTTTSTKVEDIAAEDDNLNLDFKISDTESYFRGDGKITFLGQSIDVYVDAGSEGLEFALTTENDVLSTNLGVTVDDSGFAASGDIDLDLDVDVDLGVLGTYKLVDLGVSADASISVGADGFSSSFSGSLNVYGYSVDFSVKVDVPISDLEALYDLLLADIVSEIESAATSIFGTVEEWANAIADGVVEFAGDVADVAKDVYNATEEAFIAAAETLGQTAEDIAAGLSSAYNAAEDAVAGFLDDAGYAIEDITNALASEFNATVDDVVGILKDIGYGIDSITSTLASELNATANDIADAFKDAGYAINQITRTLANELNATANDIADALKDAGYAINQITRTLANELNATANDIADALKDAGYAINDITNSIRNFVSPLADDVADALAYAGYPATAVADALSDVGGYTVTQVGNALDSAFDLSANAMADALEYAGYAVDEVGSFLSDTLDYAESTVKDALGYAGYTADEISNWAEDFWESVTSGY